MNINELPPDQRLPIFKDPLIIGTVVAETEGFAEGEGVRATLLAHDLVVEITSAEAEGQLIIPITTLLDAIQRVNRSHES